MKKILIGLIAFLICSLVVFSTGAIGFDDIGDILPPSKVITITTPDGTIVTIPMGGEEGVGGTVYNRELYFNEGFYVDDTKVVDGSGNWDGAVTGTTGTFSSTLGVTGAVTLSSTLGVTGATTLSSTLGVTGAVTLDDDLIVDTNTLFVDDSANGVGVGTTTPSSLFSVVVSNSDVFTVNGSTGAAVFSQLVSVNDSTQSTLKIGGTGSLTGCLVMGDSGGAATKYYITVTGGTVSATSTQPSICQ